MRTSRYKFSRAKSPSGGFAFIELLTVVAAIAILIALVIPGVAAVRNQARITQCASNLRQIARGLENYVTSGADHYPPNLDSGKQYWYDPSRAGGQLGGGSQMAEGLGGSILACPADPDGERSYSMNIWASCRIDPYYLPVSPSRGKLWGPASAGASRLILVADSWSYTGSAGWGWFAPATIGYAGATTGQKFGAGGGIEPPLSAGRWGQVNSELPFLRHRPVNSSGTGTQPTGQINIGYADGHVELRSQNDLANSSTGVSTGDSLWFPGDTGE
jgi:prepilin-type processing-associated H-X9-DG protein